ncbi:MAG: SDR family NAD(P)-dependent oxidoreductase [Oscillospiraceae bacterium]|nr:SDR family NAD(P)-dependent oxidoreductase [Oscillospiraceae bacterium]
MQKIVLITGGSSGIGLAAARQLAAMGHSVYELSRSGQSSENITHITGDVTDEQSVQAAVGAVVAREGRLDILICSAGFGISGAAETTALSDAKRQFEVNYFGTVSAVTAALPHLRATHGRIVAVSSVAAILPVPFQAHYSAAKAALNAFTLALASETAAHGVTVCAVMPGDTKTGFTGARSKSADDGVYAETVTRSVGRMERDETHGMPSDAVARVVVKAATKRRVRPFYTAGGVYRLFGVLAKVLPAGLARWIEGRMYAK